MLIRKLPVELNHIVHQAAWYIAIYLHTVGGECDQRVEAALDHIPPGNIALHVGENT
jgi:hypothetical protein